MKPRRRARRQRKLYAASILLSALALVGNLATNTVRIEQPWWPPTVWAAVALLVFFAAANAVSGRREERNPPLFDPVHQAKDWLFAQEKDQRTRDVERAQLQRPVRVRWSSTARPVTARSSVVIDGKTDVPWHDLLLMGDVTGIVQEFCDLPTRQLVILGEAGAGKSALATLLGLGLLERRQVALTKTENSTHGVPDAGVDAAHPIAVYLSIASWHPVRERIEEFLVRRLHEQFEFPGEVPREYGTCFADVLLRKGNILPVLDGLDELPTGLRAAAIEGLEAFAAANLPFVLTCRTTEYEQAVVRSGLVLSRAAVIEIEPVDVETAITFLSESTSSAERWAGVFTHLRRSPDSPLAQVLSTPLMVSLAGIAYRPVGADPGALLELPDFTTIAGTLLDQYISSVYSARTTLPGQTVRRYDPVKVTRWYTYLAHHLYQSGRRELRWWQLTPALLPGVLQRKGFLLALSTLFILVTTMSTGFLVLEERKAIELALVAAAIVGAGLSGMFSFLWPTRYQPPGKRLADPAIREDHPSYTMLFGFFLGALGGVLTEDPATGVGAGLLCALHAAFVPHWTVRTLPRLEPEFRSWQSSPAHTVAVNRWNAARAAMQYGVVGGLAFAVVDSVMPDLPGAGGVVPPENLLQTAVIGGAVCAASAAYCAGLGVWTRFRLTSLLLALFGRLPWRLLTFLNDGHVRGALRQAGDSWQFRHVLLQDHLSEKLQSTNVWTRLKGGEEAAVNRLADLLAVKGRTGELKAIADVGNRYATFRLIDALEALGHVDEAIAIAEDRAKAADWQATTRLVDLLADHGRTESVRQYADRKNSHAIVRLAMIHAEAGDIDEVVALTLVQLNANDWRAAEPLLDLLSRHGRTDVIRHLAEALPETLGVNWLTTRLAEYDRVDALCALARQSNSLASGRVFDSLVNLGHAEKAIAIAEEHAAAGGWLANKRLIQLLVLTDRLADAAAVAERLAQTGNKLANEMYYEVLAARGAHETIQARACDGDPVALGHHARRLAEQGHVLKAVALIRRHASQVELTDVFAVMDAAAGDGHLDSLRFLAASTNTRAVLHLVRLMATAGDEAGALSVATGHPGSRDRRTVGQFVEMLVELNRVDDALRLAQHHDKRCFGKFTGQLVDCMVTRGRASTAIDVLRQFAEAGDTAAMDRLIGLLATTGRIDEAILLAEETANPRSDAWPSVDRLIGLLKNRGRIDDAIAIARLRADGGRGATWTCLRSARAPSAG